MPSVSDTAGGLGYCGIEGVCGTRSATGLAKPALPSLETCPSEGEVIGVRVSEVSPTESVFVFCG